MYQAALPSTTATASSATDKRLRARNTDPEVWYGRFTGVRASDLQTSGELTPYLMRPALDFLTIHNLPASKVPNPATQNDIFAQRIKYMLALNTHSMHQKIIHNIACLFFYLTLHESLPIWEASDPVSTTYKPPHLNVPKLFTMLYSPPPLGQEQDPLIHRSYTTFSATLKKAHQDGAAIARLSHSLGLGCLILLHPFLRTVYGATRGGECLGRGTPVFWDKKPSLVATEWLKSQGIVGAGSSTGVTGLVGAVLKEWFRGIKGWEGVFADGDVVRRGGFPGFPG
ncbi:hypothetical protein N0V94_008733 [Neodidymelliopsis sp. IMI 364377]|nr:hypothetical protein N0V94_008733 [Neodidymelliopsis sp. IMI 364377]